MKSPKKNGIGEVVTDYGRRVMRIFKKGLLQRSLFDFYGDIKADSVKIKESSSVPSTPVDGDGGVIYIKSTDGKLYFKSNEVAEVELSAADTVLTSEQVQDIVGAMFSSNTETNITVTYQDGDGTIDLVATDTNTQLTTEEVQDIVGAMFTSNTETRISATYEDSDGTIDLVVDDMTADTQLTTEQVQDIVGAMFSGNTETRISVTYEDGDGTIDLVVDAIPVDLTVDGAGTIHANNVPTLNQDTTGNANTATTAQRIIGAADADVAITSDGNVNITLDNDDDETSQKLKILNSAGTEVGSISEDGDFYVTGNVTNSGSDNNLEIHSDGNMSFIIDRDNDETSQSFSFKNFNVEIANLDESGNLQIDGDLTVSGGNITNAVTFDSGLNCTGNLTVNGDSVTFESANADDPIFTIKNTSNDTNDAAQMIFVKDRGVAPAVGTNIGEVRFKGEDSNQNSQEYGGFLCEIDVATDGQESGMFGIFVATHDGELQYGLQLTGGSEEDEVDVSIGQGSNSSTSVAGNLNVTGIITGKQYQVFPTNFIDDFGTSEVFMPIHGTTFEQAQVYQDDVALLAPCDGRVVSVTLSILSVTGNADLTVRVYTLGPNVSGTSLSSWTLEESEVLPITSTDDNHVLHFGFSNAKHFESTEKFAVSIQADSDIMGNTFIYATTVIEWDYNTLLGSSAEYDSVP